MKILIVSTYDRGGAANACLRLHEGLSLEKIDSKVLLKRKEKGIPRTYQFLQPQQEISKFQLFKKKNITFLRLLGVIKKSTSLEDVKFLKSRPSNLELFSFPYSNFDITSSPLYHEADIINLHWVADFLDYDSFFRKNTKPVVWTLHDMNPFTGGEHYLEWYVDMDVNGTPVKRKLTENEHRISTKSLTIKRNALHAVSNLTIVAPSQWLCNEAKKSELFKTKEIHYIPYGVDSKIFKPRHKVYSRDILNIPKDRTVILFVADSISNHRKGYAYLKKALEQLQNDDVVLCAVGRKISGLNSTNSIIELGAINDDRLMSLVYSAADVFVIPSLMDNLPNTVLESLMCGTPVIGFPVGGIPDMVEHGQNGLLADEINSHSLFLAIEQFLNTINSFDRDYIREHAVNKYALSIQANAYINLFRKMLKIKGD